MTTPKMTLPEAIAIVRAACEKVLEADKKATKGPWYVEEGYHRHPEECGVSIDVVTVPGEKGHTLFDTYNRGYKESGLDRTDDGEWFDARGEKDLSFVALSRNLSPAMARLLLALTDPKQSGSDGQSAILAAAEELSR